MTQLAQLSSLEIINENSLQITFTDSWYQEDIAQLTLYVLHFLTDHQVIEIVSGADREYCRFQWQQDYFIIQFECYSQSCWIENETTPNTSLLHEIKATLTKDT